MGRIVVNLDVEMAKRKMSLSELAERVGLTLANLSILKTGRLERPRLCASPPLRLSAENWDASLATYWNTEMNKCYDMIRIITRDTAWNAFNNI